MPSPHAEPRSSRRVDTAVPALLISPISNPRSECVTVCPLNNSGHSECDDSWVTEDARRAPEVRGGTSGDVEKQKWASTCLLDTMETLWGRSAVGSGFSFSSESRAVLLQFPFQSGESQPWMEAMDGYKKISFVQEMEESRARVEKWAALTWFGSIRYILH